MKTIYSSLNLVEVHHLKNLLQSAGIRCSIRNEDLVRLAGEAGLDAARAQAILAGGEYAEAVRERQRFYLEQIGRASCRERV